MQPDVIPLVYLIFLFWDAIAYIVIYFAMVETKGLSLERMSSYAQKQCESLMPRLHQKSMTCLTNPILEDIALSIGSMSGTSILRGNLKSKNFSISGMVSFSQL